MPRLNPKVAELLPRLRERCTTMAETLRAFHGELQQLAKEMPPISEERRLELLQSSAGEMLLEGEVADFLADPFRGSAPSDLAEIASWFEEMAQATPASLRAQELERRREDRENERQCEQWERERAERERAQRERDAVPAELLDRIEKLPPESAETVAGMLEWLRLGMRPGESAATT